ncbi:hypothetical protein QFZ40_000262 [Arthrobacter pascens]|uniref:hypothetical protein n=1 Tax=Arthrobacter pascens TaxID=1677 RepID=UPI00277EA6E0|nr:hypothetical protein [Arthrobacter pascens]MDQ0632353.1 hypothetical protein [Arthrobacter pascens]
MMGFDQHGLIEDYRVMVRPLSAVVALRDAAFSQTIEPVEYLRGIRQARLVFP